MTPEDELDIRLKAEGSPGEANRSIPRWLLVVYGILPIWGILWFFLYLNGSGSGFLDRGFWEQLQIEARTTWDSSHYGIEEANEQPDPKQLR